ncbi:hypothetical protein DFS34DRAFT_637551 [Phlyctochytrium arcticum]|nr:hypothetical protein DFS34DRAFT_637551 [Phlyctochytrium arcticum]
MHFLGSIFFIPSTLKPVRALWAYAAITSWGRDVPPAAYSRRTGRKVVHQRPPTPQSSTTVENRIWTHDLHGYPL